jgi:hypothetical protein
MLTANTERSSTHEHLHFVSSKTSEAKKQDLGSQS